MSAHYDERALNAFVSVPRRAFIRSTDLLELPVTRTIPSQSSIRALLAHTPVLRDTDRVLLVGAGSGYLATVLSRLVAELVIVELHAPMADIARTNMAAFDVANVTLRVGEGAKGAPDLAPFDLIIVVCELASLQALFAQLADNGVLVQLEPAPGAWGALRAWQRNDQGSMTSRDLCIIQYDADVGDTLIDLELLDASELQQARQEAERTGLPLMSVLQRRVGEEDISLYRTLARRMGMRFDAADNLFGDIDRSLFRKFSRTFLDHYRVIPIRLKGDTLEVVTDDPEASVEPLEAMMPGKSVERVLVTPTDYRRLWSTISLIEKGIHHRPQALPVSERNAQFESNFDDVEHHISPYLVAMYESILFDAVSERASDIHIERYHQRVRIRLRIDGELTDLDHYMLTPAEMAGVVNVIKTRAELNIAERRLPQGGRARLRVGTVTYDLRIQTQPSLHGEHVVIRLLPQSGRAMGLDQLGLSARIAQQYRRLLDNPAGLVLIVGPTGSGKSTTLSAGLQALADDGRRKVITVEDPIEYAIDNIQQTRVRSKIGFNFADAMRAFVRQDPDVILVGEIRDAETALEAARASQTGHLVLSTLHCNDAVDAVQRLYDLGLHPNSIASELLAVMAQRLAKRICEHCREPVEPDARLLRELFPDEVPANFRCFHGKGCDKCNHRGTRGRVAVVEFLQVNADFRDFVSRQPPLGELRWRALDAGLVTMRDSAIELVVQGVIPLTEIPRILPSERMAPEPRGGVRNV